MKKDKSSQREKKRSRGLTVNLKREARSLDKQGSGQKREVERERDRQTAKQKK